MCISASHSVMSDTLIYVGEGTYNNKYVHVIAYQNKALSTVPNAMILPFPTNQEMSQDNIIDTSSFKSFLKDISDASMFRTLGVSKGLRLNSVGTRRAQIFQSGSYTVLLAHHVEDVPEALTQVPENKRPKITEKFLNGYQELYPNQPIAICCWEGSVKAEPLLWWYEPSEKNYLFIPTMDAHDGDVPKINAFVNTDHLISVGSTIQEIKNNKVYYTNTLPDNVKSLLPTNVFGGKINKKIVNGDMWTYSDLMDKAPELSRGYFRSKLASNQKFRLGGWM